MSCIQTVLLLCSYLLWLLFSPSTFPHEETFGIANVSVCLNLAVLASSPQPREKLHTEDEKVYEGFPGTGCNISTEGDPVTLQYYKLSLSIVSPLIGQLPGEVEKVDAGTINTILVNESRSSPAGEDGPLVGLGQSFQ